MTHLTLKQRYAGALVGLACGDAVGTSVEFSPRDSFPPVTDMQGGGPFHLQPGQWTDDTSMALCLAQSLIDRKGFDAGDQMARYVNWWRRGYLSSTGSCFDIGMTTQRALARYEVTGDPYAGSTDPSEAGNGSVMRLAPVVLFYFPARDRAVHFAAESSRTTHGAAEAMDCCRLLAHVLVQALSGTGKDALLEGATSATAEADVRSIARGAYRNKPRSLIAGTGYCVAALEAALWCVHQTRTFEQAILLATNLGDDADTTAAITGQIAGALYGLPAVPGKWLRTLHMSTEIVAMAEALHDLANAP